MKVLNLENCQNVSGGDIAVSLAANVPTDATPTFINLVGLLLTNQLTAESLGQLITENAGAFNEMPLEKITVGNFAITRV